MLAVVVASAAGAGCSSPLASRRAQVMEPGELELSLVPYVEGTTVVAGGVPFAPLAYPFVEATARVASWTASTCR